MTASRLLIACIGNIFLGDDAFGVEVARRLAAIDLPEGVRAVDFGIRGIDLTYALMDGYESVILVDATPRGGQPGTLYVIEPTLEDCPGPDGTLLDAHGMDPVKVLKLAASMGARVDRLMLVGCEPEPFADADWNDIQPGLSESVQNAVEEAIPLILSLVGRLLSREDFATGGIEIVFQKEEAAR